MPWGSRVLGGFMRPFGKVTAKGPTQREASQRDPKKQAGMELLWDLGSLAILLSQSSPPCPDCPISDGGGWIVWLLDWSQRGCLSRQLSLNSSFPFLLSDKKLRGVPPKQEFFPSWGESE